MQKFVVVDIRDNVAAALTLLPKGEKIVVDGAELEMASAVNAKHKFARYPIAIGQDIVMYGVPVGKAVTEIPRGMGLTTENVAHSKLEHIKRSGETFKWQPPDVSPWQSKTWMGYKREDGRYGTRNIWLVIPLVFCENRNTDVLRETLERSLGYRNNTTKQYNIESLIKAYEGGTLPNDLKKLKPTQWREKADRRVFQHLDSIQFLTHQTGCGGTRSDSDSFSALVAGYITHPNCAGATILSLGCQNAEMEGVRKRVNKRAPQFERPIIWLEQQQFSAENDFLEAAIIQTFAGMAKANESQRTPAPPSAITLGLECGGSDGFSGISANPVLGSASDRLVALGGSSILSEFPELSGVEQNLVSRCASDEKADRFMHLMKRYGEILHWSGSGFDANPSPGNIREGLITGAMKSAGAARKGGTSPITDVLDYTEQQRIPGLNLLCTPGNDVESTTALAGSGANLIVFTTGLGTPTGNPLAPVVKMSSSTSLALKMPHIIDFDGGPVIGGMPIHKLAAELLDYLLEVASGKQVNAELLGQSDFIPWKRDISL